MLPHKRTESYQSIDGYTKVDYLLNINTNFDLIIISQICTVINEINWREIGNSVRRDLIT